MIALLIVAVASLASLLACLSLESLAHGHVLLGLIEWGLVLVLGRWVIALASDLFGAWRVADHIAASSRPAMVAGRSCRFTRDERSEALVIGVIRPQVYLAEGLVDRLDTEALTAIVLHEEHHRLTRAPLRSAAVHAWLRVVGRWTPARRHLEARLDALESHADAYAISQGVSATAIARALVLVAVPTVGRGSGFATHGDARIRALLGAADPGTPPLPNPLPYEWLPVAVLLGIWFACSLV